MRKAVGRAPKQLDAGALLLFLQDFYNRIEVLVGLAQVPSFGRDVAIVEAIKRRAELPDELERNPDAALGVANGVRTVIPRADSGADAKRIAQRIAKRVPVAHSETQVIAQWFAVEFLGGMVVLERQWVSRLWPLVFDSRNIGESLCRHNGLCLPPEIRQRV